MSETYTKQSYSQRPNYATQLVKTNQAGPDQVSNLVSGGWNQILGNQVTGTYNPKWRSQVRLGQNATTASNGYKWHISPGWISYGTREVWTNDSSRIYYFEDTGLYIQQLPFVSIVSVPSDVQTRVINRVIQKFFNACQDARTAFEAGQDLGEYKETLHSIHKPLNSLASKLHEYLTVLKKRKVGRIRGVRLSKVLADTYLEFRFGWLPLVDDVASAIVKCGSYRFPVVPVRAAANENYSVSSGRVDLPLPGGFSNHLRPVVYTKDSSRYYIRYKGSIRTGSDPNGRTSTVQELQLLPRDWLPTAWDLLPYSWIADYFTNIGEMIQSLCFGFSDLTWGNKTEITERNFEFDRIELTNPQVNLFSYPWRRVEFTPYANPSRSNYVLRYFTRSQLNVTDLFARFEFRIPSSKYPFLNLAALLEQRAAKLVPFF